MATKNEVLGPGSLEMPQQQGGVAGSVNFFDRLPERVVDSLTPEQRQAIQHAADDPAWRGAPVDIRVTVPFFGRRYFFTLVGGAEKRSHERRAEERHHYPLRTAANAFFFIGLATIFYAAAVVVLALQSAIVEF